ncbi:Eukaryotic translation initiation factor 1A, X-chromosomal [Trachymyrmex septentrionalis]|uniref:Eukaryotic translation initiation factor 4C n=1 Tax=Trachymyrmex septentrionalis TaxID=34720 RepID=A0A195F7C2_9HYME|nr:Eukaryotic translation initiation factor 1A, X-chromosomal [Trachymyrmex septentrionalis]
MPPKFRFRGASIYSQYGAGHVINDNIAEMIAFKLFSLEKKIVNAAEDVANTLGGDKTKTTSDLLEKILASRVKALKKIQESTKNVKQLSKYDVQKNSQGQTKHLEKKSIIQNLLDEYNKQPIKKAIEDSISRKLLRSVTPSKEMLQDTKRERTPRARFENINLWNGKPTNIFENMNAPSPNIPELKTWAALEQRELKSLTTHPPANVFQELILWTEQGKLWKFPIDNEQGMEEEQNVHFSEHVFMERNLKGWCPKAGPIRHFMELVCTGLSKNPYLTVQEKIGHIMWYKEYFESKQDLLQEADISQSAIDYLCSSSTLCHNSQGSSKRKGGKNRRRGKNENETEKRELVFKEDGQEYAQVTKMLGNGRLEAMCFDGVKRLCHIRGKLRKKVWINQGDIILIGLRDYQDAKADVILKYTSDEARNLKTYGEFPETVRINDTVTFVEDGFDEDIEFGDEISDDDEDDVDNMLFQFTLVHVDDNVDSITASSLQLTSM